MLVHVRWCGLSSHGLDAGDPSTLTQDELFTRAIASRLVPRAAHHDSKLASTVCAMLDGAPKHASLSKLIKMIKHTPDVQNVVLETAITGSSCNVTHAVRRALMDHLQSPVGPEGMLPHLRRSASFILAASHDRETLQFLMDAIVLGDDDSVESGLRAVDRSTLLHRIIRSSVTGFNAAAETLQGYAEGTDDWSSGDADQLAQMAPWAVLGSQETLPEWLPLDQLGESTRRVLVLQKQIDSDAAQIVCGTK